MAFGGLDFKSIKDGVLSSDGLDGMSQLDSINRAAKNALERTKLRSEYSRKIADQDADAALNMAKMQYGLTDGDIFNSQLEKGWMVLDYSIASKTKNQLKVDSVVF